LYAGYNHGLADGRIGRDERALLFTLARQVSNIRYHRCIARLDINKEIDFRGAQVLDLLPAMLHMQNERDEI